jgi:hypothetical protein
MSILNFRKRHVVAFALAAGVTGLGTGLAYASQPDMVGALHALDNAQSHLERVTQNKGGHAAAARRLIAEAIAEVKAGIAVGHEHGE